MGESPETELWREETRDAVQALRLAVEAVKEQQEHQIELMRQADARSRRLQQDLAALQVQHAALTSRIQSLEDRHATRSETSHPPPSWSGETAQEVQAAYQRALQQYRERNFTVAMDLFAEIILRAPHSEWADNAQYWRAECLYGLERYRQALAEFTKVFAYENTQKADDAQFKIGRCYVALGETERAHAAFNKLLAEYPDSEYADLARQQLRHLR